jgi:hypothetical protein
MWLSLICTKLKSDCFALCIRWPKTRETGTPPANVHTNPVPAQAMHFKKPRRSMPSGLISPFGLVSLCSVFNAAWEDPSPRFVEWLIFAPRRTNAVHLRELSQLIFIPALIQKK